MSCMMPGHSAGGFVMTGVERACGQTVAVRAYCVSALKPHRSWEGPQRKCQGFKPDRGNPAVRDYRGASGNVAMVEMRSHLATERAGVVTLHLKAGAPEFYPNRARDPRMGREVAIKVSAERFGDRFE